MVEKFNPNPKERLLNQYNIEFRGRIMVEEVRSDSKGNTYSVEVPMVLLPIERVILTILAFSPEQGTTGRSLSKKVIPEKRKVPSKIYTTLARLKRWGYVNWETKGSVERIGEGPVRNLNIVTELGIARLKKDYQS